MVANGIPPLSGGPSTDLASIPGDVVALRPAGFLWLGLLAVLATPIARVIAAGVGFALAGDRQMVVVAVATSSVSSGSQSAARSRSAEAPALRYTRPTLQARAIASRRQRRSRPHDHRHHVRLAGPTAHHAPTPGSMDELICYFEGAFVPMKDAKVSIMTRVHVWDRYVRGHPRLLERGAGQALRAEGARARRAHPPVMPDADAERPVGRRVDAPHHRDRATEWLPRDVYIRPSFYKSTKAIGVGSTTSTTTCPSSPCLSGIHRHGQRRA